MIHLSKTYWFLIIKEAESAHLRCVCNVEFWKCSDLLCICQVLHEKRQAVGSRSLESCVGVWVCLQSGDLSNRIAVLELQSKDLSNRIIVLEPKVKTSQTESLFWNYKVRTSRTESLFWSYRTESLFWSYKVKTFLTESLFWSYKVPSVDTEKNPEITPLSFCM